MSDQSIERYIYAVTRHLPQKKRADVSQALRSEIEGKIEEGADERKIRDILIAFGPPEIRAAQYDTSTRRFFSGATFYTFRSLLRWLLPLMMFIAFLGGLLSATLDGTRLREGIGATLARGALFLAIAALLTLLITTIVFVLIDRKAKSKGEKLSWTPEDLPALPEEVPLPMSGNVLDIVFHMIFLVLAWLIAYGHLPVVVGIGASCVPLFTPSLLAILFPTALIVTIFNMLSSILKIIDRRWTLPVTLSHIVASAVLAGVSLYVIHSVHVFNPQVLGFLASLKIGSFALSNVLSLETIPMWQIAISALIVISSVLEIGRVIKKRVQAARTDS